MGTNVTSDGSAEYQLIYHILDFFEQAYLKHDDSVKARLIRQLKQHVNMNGADSVYYKMVSQKYAGSIENALLARKMPYIRFFDTHGNTVFLVRDIDREKFENLQKDVFSLSPEYYAQITVENLCNIAQKDGQKELIEISCDTANMYEVLKAKAYQEGSGIVCAPGKTPDDLGISPGGYKMFLHPNSVYKKSGNDLATMRLELALRASKGDLLDLRQDQAEYDRAETGIVIAELKKGHSVAIADQLNNSNMYITVDTDHMCVSEKDSNGMWVETVVIDVPDLSDGAKAAEFQIMLQTYCQKIKDMRAMTMSDFTDHMKKSPDELKAEVLSTPQYAYNVTNDSSEIVKNYYPQKEGETDDEYEQRIKEVTPHFEASRHNINSTNRPFRPSIEHSTATQKDLDKYGLYEKSGSRLLAAIDREAHRRVEAIPGAAHMSSKQKYERMVVETIKILEERELPEFEQFLRGYGEYTSSDAANWLDELSTTYKNPQRNEFGAFDIGSRTVKDVRANERTEQTHDREMPKDYQTPDYDEE